MALHAAQGPKHSPYPLRAFLLLDPFLYKQIQTCIYKLFEKEANGFLSRYLKIFLFVN
ncbi:hypothetical protein IAF31_18085 [Acinetobacter baumannii]|nr:hypothetical protein [Acinetobacter baumannii]